MDNTVIRFWDAIRAKWPTPQPEWNKLNPQLQMMVMSSLDTMIQVMDTPK